MTTTMAKQGSGFTGWLITAGIFVVATVGTWLISTPPKVAQNTKTAEITSQDLPLPKKIENFTQFSKEVPVLDVSSTLIRDLRNYPAEFKDKKYFEKHKRSWTLQVMDVAEHDIITGYLKGRNDRDKFAYLRYKNKAGETRFILTYGLAKSSQDASNFIKTADLGLPQTVAPIPEKMERYLSIIDTYERNDDVVDLAPNAPRKIRLQATKAQVPPATPKEASSSRSAPSSSTQSAPPVKPQNFTKPKQDNTGEVSYGNTASSSSSRPNVSNNNNNNNNTNRSSESRSSDNSQAQPRPKPKQPSKEVARENQANDTVEYKAHGKVEYSAKKDNEHSPKTEHKLKTDHKADTRPEHKAEHKAAEPKPKAEHKPKEVAAPITDTPSTPGSD